MVKFAREFELKDNFLDLSLDLSDSDGNQFHLFIVLVGPQKIQQLPALFMKQLLVIADEVLDILQRVQRFLESCLDALGWIPHVVDDHA